MSAGVVEIDLRTHSVFVNGRESRFTLTEFRLLLVLADRAPAVVSPQELVWRAVGYQMYLNEARGIVRWHIHHMRRKIQDNARKPRYICNVRSVGYRLAALPLIHDSGKLRWPGADRVMSSAEGGEDREWLRAC